MGPRRGRGGPCQAGGAPLARLLGRPRRTCRAPTPTPTLCSPPKTPPTPPAPVGRQGLARPLGRAPHRRRRRARRGGRGRRGRRRVEPRAALRRERAPVRAAQGCVLRSWGSLCAPRQGACDLFWVGPAVRAAQGCVRLLGLGVAVCAAPGCLPWGWGPLFVPRQGACIVGVSPRALVYGRVFCFVVGAGGGGEGSGRVLTPVPCACPPLALAAAPLANTACRGTRRAASPPAPNPQPPSASPPLPRRLPPPRPRQARRPRTTGTSW
jgi:hypothetical protein